MLISLEETMKKHIDYKSFDAGKIPGYPSYYTCDGKVLDASIEGFTIGITYMYRDGNLRSDMV